MTDHIVLDVRQLSKWYGRAVHALDSVSFQADRESFLCIVGPSGCGKSTLLRLMAGLIEPTRGEIRLDGELVEGPRRRIGFVFQEDNLMPWRSTLENVALPLELEGVRAQERQVAAGDLLGLVGLAGFEGSLPKDLSGGMSQRVAIARALIHEPEILLLDEPLGSLDAMTRERMASEIMRIWRERTVTAVMVTHSIPEAVLLADKVIVLSQRPGSVVFETSIGLARPRELDMVYTPEFGKYVEQIRAAIR